jgi:hypothetical protein
MDGGVLAWPLLRARAERIKLKIHACVVSSVFHAVAFADWAALRADAVAFADWAALKVLACAFADWAALRADAWAFADWAALRVLA